MSGNSMDDLLRQADVAAKKKAADKQAAQQEQQRLNEISQRQDEAFRGLLDQVKAQVELFNSRSTSGQISIRPTRSEGVFTMPNTGRTVTLSERQHPTPTTIKQKTCSLMATLSEGRGYGIHFLFLEDGEGVGAWVAVRVKYSAFANDRREKVAPFITTLAEIARGTNAMHVIEPEYSEDLDGAIREMLGYGLAV